MVDFLLSSTLTCEDANTVIQRIRDHENLKSQWKVELIETIQDYTPRVSMGRKRLKEREKRILRKQRRLISPTSGVHQMNTLTIIKKQIQKASALHDAQITHTAYRGVEYECKQGSRGNSWHLLLSWSHLR